MLAKNTNCCWRKKVVTKKCKSFAYMHLFLFKSLTLIQEGVIFCRQRKAFFLFFEFLIYSISPLDSRKFSEET